MYKEDLRNLKYALIVTLLVASYFLYQKVDHMADSIQNQNIAQEPEEVPNNFAGAPGRDRAPKASGLLDQKELPRAPASIPGLTGNTPPETHLERKVISAQKGPKEMANKYSPHWKDLALTQLRHGHSVNTIIDITPISGLIEDRGGKNYYMEHVKVSTTLPNGKRYSYHAMVNSENGEIVSSWNYQRPERDPVTLKARGFRTQP